MTEGHKNRLVLWPGAETGRANPYLAHFAESLHESGFDVDSFTLPRWAFGVNSYDALVMHWPEAAARTDNRLVQLMTFRLFLLSVDVFRSRGGKVVWVFHNEQPHTKSDLPLDDFARRVDGLLSPSEIGLNLAQRLHSALGSVPSGLSRLGRYATEDYTPPTPVSRADVGIAEDGELILHFGYLRPYKGVERLIEAVAELDRPNVQLLIAGQPLDQTYAEDLQRLATPHPNVHIRLGRADRKTLAGYLSLASAAVFPFTRMLHSGSILLARSAGLPVLAPAIGSSPEYAELDPGLHIYEPALSADDLDKFLDQVGDPHAVPPLPDEFNWPSITASTSQLLRQVLPSLAGTAR